MVTFTLNGKTVTSHSPCNTTLLEVLRKEFYLTGVKKAVRPVSAAHARYSSMGKM